jgi:hypothetical protein
LIRSIKEHLAYISKLQTGKGLGKLMDAFVICCTWEELPSIKNSGLLSTPGILGAMLTFEI